MNLKHGAARRKQVRIWRASSPRGGTFKQHVVLIPQSALRTMQAKPIAPSSALIALRDDRKGMAAQPEPNNPKHTRGRHGQAEKGIMRSTMRQSKPAQVLAEVGALSSARARRHITLPALLFAGIEQLHGSGNINGNHAAVVHMEGVAQSSQVRLQ